MTSAADSPSHSPHSYGIREWLLAFGVSLVTAMLLISPFFWLGNASGHDLIFHVSSWMDVAGQWREGMVYPRWAEWANYGFGEPRFVFYPPLSWMMGAALSFLMPWNAVPGAFIVLVQTIAGLCFFAVGRRFLSSAAALFGAACYAANPYAQLIIYMRSDFAELLACALLPVLLLAAIEVAGLIENRGRSPARAIAVFSMVFACVWLSNAPAGVIASYSFALFFVWASTIERSWRPLLRGMAGLALGFALAAVYLVPAAYEQRWVNISQALSSGLLPSQNFLYSIIEDPEHNAFNWIASTAAVAMIVLTGIAAVVAHRDAKSEKIHGENEKVWRGFMLLAGAATLLMIRVSAVLWEYLPELRFVQFPWRWMAILALPFTYFICAALAKQRLAWMWVAVTLLAAGGTGALLVHATWWDADDIPSLQDALENDQGFEGTDEYDPVGDDHSRLPQKAPRVEILRSDRPEEQTAAAVDTRVERWTAEERVWSVTTRVPVTLAVRLLNYPAWRVEVNGQPVTPERRTARGQMILGISPGTQRITAKFIRTPDRTVGVVISLVALLVLLGLFSAGGVRLLSASP